MQAKVILEQDPVVNIWAQMENVGGFKMKNSKVHLI
jgi:hypothetical protein